MLTRDQLIGVLRRTTDVDGWLTPLLADPSSEAVLNAMAAVWTQVSLSSDAIGNAGMITLAPGGNAANAVITLSRPAPGPAGTLPVGFRWKNARGSVFINQAPVVILAGTLTITASVNSLFKSDLANTIIDEVFVPDTENAAAPLALALGFTYTSTPSVGGALDWLSAHGSERGQQRQFGEPTADYRQRVRNIPDSVSPSAIVNSVQGVANQRGLPIPIVKEPEFWSPEQSVTNATNATPIVVTTLASHGYATNETVEVFGVLGNLAANGIWQVDVLTDTTFQLRGSVGSGAYVASPTDFVVGKYLGLGAFTTSFCDDAFCDDASTYIVGRREACAYFLVEMPGIPRDPDSLRLFLDAGFADDPVFGFLDVVESPVITSGLLAMHEELDRKRAACVQFDIAIDAFTELDAHALAGPLAVMTTVFTLTPPAGKVWIFVETVIGHTPPVVGIAHQIRVTYSDATVVSTPPYGGFDSQRITPADLGAFGPVKTVTQIEGRLLTPAAPATLNAHVRLIEMAA
jgi:hypothetical protein